MAATPLDASEIRLLTEIGFVAAAGAQVDRAAEVFRALVHLRPQRSFPYIGWALALLNAGRAQEAVETLDRAKVALGSARQDADLVDAEAFRGLALQQAGRSAESRRALEWAAEHDPVGSTGRLVRGLLGGERVV